MDRIVPTDCQDRECEAFKPLKIKANNWECRSLRAQLIIVDTYVYFSIKPANCFANRW